MDFEIEEDPEDDFQKKWSKPSKGGGFFGGGFGGGKKGGDDIYDYDFDGGGYGKNDFEISHYSTPPSEKTKNKSSTTTNVISSKGNSKDSSKPASSVPTTATSQMSAMEKAQLMLNKYSGKGNTSTAGVAKKSTIPSRNFLTEEFNEDDISIGSDELSTSGVMKMPPKSTKTQLSKESPKKQTREPVKQQLSRGYDLENDDDDDELSESEEMESAKLISRSSVYDLGMHPPSTKSNHPPTNKPQEDDDYSKDRFDEGSVSFDEYGKEGVYQEGSVLSDSAVVVEGEEDEDDDEENRYGHHSFGNQSSYEVDDEDVKDEDKDKDKDDERGNYVSSRPKVFEFSDLGDILAPGADVAETDLELEIYQPTSNPNPAEGEEEEEVEESHVDFVEESNIYGNSFESDADSRTPKKEVKVAVVKTFPQPTKEVPLTKSAAPSNVPPPAVIERTITPSQPMNQPAIVKPIEKVSQPALSTQPPILESSKLTTHNPRISVQPTGHEVSQHQQPPVQSVPLTTSATVREKLTINPNPSDVSNYPPSHPPHPPPFTEPQQPLPAHAATLPPQMQANYYPQYPQYPQTQYPPGPPGPPGAYQNPYNPYPQPYQPNQYPPQSPQMPPLPPTPLWPPNSMYPPYPYPPPAFYPPQMPYQFPQNPFYPNPYQPYSNTGNNNNSNGNGSGININPLNQNTFPPFSTQQSLINLLQRSGIAQPPPPPPPPEETNGPTMAEILRELQAAKEEAAFATKKLADVILEVHRSKTVPSARSPQTKSKKSPGRSRSQPSIQESAKEDHDDDEDQNENDENDNGGEGEGEYEYDDEEGYFEDEFEEESYLNISRISNSPQQKTKGPHNSCKRNKPQNHTKQEKKEESRPKSPNQLQLQPPRMTDRDSMELNWSKHLPSQHGTRRYPSESASTRESLDSLPAYPPRETFDTMLNTSQSLYRRQLLSLREKLDSMNQSSAELVSLMAGDRHDLKSLSQPLSRTSLPQTYQRSRYPSSVATSVSVRSSHEPIPDTKTKLRTALLQVDPTLSEGDLKLLMEKYS